MQKNFAEIKKSVIFAIRYNNGVVIVNNSYYENNKTGFSEHSC